MQGKNIHTINSRISTRGNWGSLQARCLMVKTSRLVHCVHILTASTAELVRPATIYLTPLIVGVIFDTADIRKIQPALLCSSHA